MGIPHQVSTKVHITPMNSTILAYTWTIGILSNCTPFLLINKVYFFLQHLLATWNSCIHSNTPYKVYNQTQQYAQHPHTLTPQLTSPNSIFIGRLLVITIHTSPSLPTIPNYLVALILISLIILALVQTTYISILHVSAIAYITITPRIIINSYTTTTIDFVCTHNPPPPQLLPPNTHTHIYFPPNKPTSHLIYPSNHPYQFPPQHVI